jgi:hypothetical protein
MKEKGSEPRDIPPWQQDLTPFAREARQGGQKGQYKRYRQAWHPRGFGQPTKGLRDLIT